MQDRFSGGGGGGGGGGGYGGGGGGMHGGGGGYGMPGDVPAVGEAATPEQVMQMQHLMMKLSVAAPSKHELRKLLQGLLGQERVAEAQVTMRRCAPSR